ncbi:YybH family protein [Reichenbachiella sp.]|uniref:YybH family protein n=1 Tax=Reichenbachiella sp. TaxID=2184521 RepID=UPI003BB0BB73
MIKSKLYSFFIFLLLCSCEANQTKTKLITQHPDPEILKEVDRAFSKLSFEKGMNHAFETYIADTGTVLRNNSFPIVGKDAVISGHFSRPDSAFRLTWEPMFADIAQSGDLGYTYGTYLVSSISGDSLGTGTYVSIWKQQQDQSWKFVFDAGNEGL